MHYYQIMFLQMTMVDDIDIRYSSDDNGGSQDFPFDVNLHIKWSISR